MILVGLSICAAIALLILIVWALHKNQQRENIESVERTLPLPPIELREASAEDLSDPEQILGLAAAPAAAPEPEPVAEPSTDTPISAQPIIAPPPSEQWLQSSRERMAAGDYEAALALCEPTLPQMGGFKQSCIVLRAQIRELLKAEQDHEPALERLYHIAATANFFHCKAPKAEILTPGLMRKIHFADFADLASPYEKLGYEHLHLLSKTDHKYLVQAWGEPEQHSQMRILHALRWQALLQSLRPH